MKPANWITMLMLPCLFSTDAIADVPVGTGYLIKSTALSTLLQKRGSIEKIKTSELRAVSEAFFNHHGMAHDFFSFNSKECSFEFNAGPSLAPPGPNGWTFTVYYNFGHHKLNVAGELVFTDAAMKIESVLPSPETRIPDASIMVNAGWREKPYTLLIYSINAKH